MATDTTASSYWLNWRVLVCALILLAPLVLAAILIWRYEGKRRERESQRELPGTLFQDEAWSTCFRRMHPLWLLAFRVFSFVAMLTLLISNVVRDGGGIFYFYTQWTFTLVTLYFGYASLLSIYGCCIYKNKEAGGNMESYTSIGDAEQGTYRPPIALDGAENTSKSSNTHSEAPIRETAGFWVYVFQILFQTCAGAVVLTDIVFWVIIYPFTKGYKLSFLDVCMHSLNAVFLLGDTCFNSLRFPLFRISYFVLWSCIFVAYQWILHAFKNLWWPYQFLDLSSPYAPLWYSGVAVMHVPCFAVFALIIKLKNFLLQRHNSCQLYSFKGIDWIASGIGAPMLSSKPWLDPTQMGEAKILVEVKLNKPFPQKVALKDNSGSITMVDVMYSWLPPKCPTCGQLGHKASRCLGLLSDVPTVSLTTPACNEVPSVATTRVINGPAPPEQHINSDSTVSSTVNVNQAPDFLFKPAAIEPIIEVPNTLITKSLTPLATQTAAQAPITAPTETTIPSEDITEVEVSSDSALLSVEERTPIQSASTKDGNATNILQELPIVPMVTNTNPFSVLDTHNNVPEDYDVLESEEVDKGDRIITMETRETPLDPDALQVEEEDGPRSRVGRALKPTIKIQDQWITVRGRGNRGRRGRGGREG